MQLNDTSTLNGLKQDLYFKGKFNAGTFNQNDLNRIINKYYEQAQMVIRGLNEGFYQIATRADLQAGTNMQYSWPGDYEKINAIYCAPTPASTAAPLRTEFYKANFATPEQITNPAYQFTVPTVVAYGDYFEVASTIANTVTGGIRLIYTPKLATLSNDTDVPNIPEDYQDVITWGALIDIAPRLNNQGLLQTATEMYKKRMQDLQDYLANRITQEEDAYVEGQGMEGNINYPFGNSWW